MFQDLIIKLTRELDAHAIPYMIIGGQAVLLHGEPRLTKDIDITLGVDTDKSAEVMSCVKNLGLKLLVENPDEFMKNTMVLPVQEQTTGIRIDFIFSYSEYERLAITRAKKIKLGETVINFVAAEDLVIHKIIAGRPRDLEDAKSVLIKNINLDRVYIQKWLGDFGVALEKDFLASLNLILSEIVR